MICSNCEKSEATIICNECNTAFCSKCSSEIHSLPIFKGHKLIETNTTSLGVCPLHNKIEILFCEVCLECCCWECVCTGQKHAGHKVVSFETAYTERKAVLEKRLAELRAVTAISRTVETVLERESQRWSDQCQAAREKIAATFGQASAAVAAQKEATLEAIEHKFAENDKVLNDAMAEYRATEEASRSALEDGKVLGANQTENLAKIGRVEQSVQVISDMNDKILHTVLPNSCVIKFNGVFGLEKPKEKKEGEEEKEEVKVEEENEIVKLVKRYGEVQSQKNGESFDELLKIKTIVKEDGKKVNDISDTHVTLTWDATPSCYTEHALSGKLTFVLKMAELSAHTSESGLKKKTEKGEKVSEEEEKEEKEEKEKEKEEEEKIIYNGTETEFRCEGLEKSKPYAFRLYAYSKGESEDLGSAYCFWKTGRVKLTLGQYTGKWKVDCPRVRVNAENPAIVQAKAGSRDSVIADTPLTPGVINRWKIRMIKSGDGWWEWLGVAPEDINLNSSSNETECGWYMNTLKTTLYAGPPFDYDSKRYGTNESGEIRMGSIVGLTMDMSTGTLSYSVNGRDLGVAYTGIPMDKPLYPAAVFNSSSQKIEIMPWEGDEDRKDGEDEDEAPSIHDSDSDEDEDVEDDSDGYMYSDGGSDYDSE